MSGTYSDSNRHRMHEEATCKELLQVRQAEMEAQHALIVKIQKENFGLRAANKQLRVDLEEADEAIAHYREDKKRLDWLLENKYALGPEQDLSNCKHTSVKSYQLIYTRKNIDKEMEEAQ